MGRPINAQVLLQQIAALNRLWRLDYGVDNVVLMDESTVRLCSRKKHKVNIDISLSSLDLYDVKAYMLRNHGLLIAVLYDEQGFYVEQLDTMLKIVMQKADEVKPSDFKPVEEFLGGGSTEN